MPTASQGSTVSFNGSTPQRLLSIRYSRSCGRLDITGLSSPDHKKEVIAGDLEPATIAISALGGVPFDIGDTGPLSVSLNDAGSISFESAFLENVDIDATAGEFIKANYTFVASH